MSQPTPNRDARELERLEAISALERGPATPDVSPVPPPQDSNLCGWCQTPIVDAPYGTIDLIRYHDRPDVENTCFDQAYKKAIAIAFPSASPAPSVGELPDTEILLAETSDVEVERYMRESFEGVGELEWQREPIGDHWWIYSTDRKWKIWFNKDAPGYFVYRVNAREWVAWEKTLDDAKNFANSLQRILSGAAEERL